MFLLICALSAAPFWNSTQDGVENAHPALAQFLNRRGYHSVPIGKRLTTKDLPVEVTVQGEKFLLFLDTGAPSTCLDPNRTKSLKLEWRTKKAIASNSNRTYSFAEIKQIRIGDISFNRRLLVGATDCSDENVDLETKSEPGLDGLLGSDLLEHFEAVIDCVDRKLHLLADPRKQGEKKDLMNFLEKHGFTSIPLKQVDCYLVVDAFVQGKQLSLVVDTGARICHLDPNRTKHLDIEWKTEKAGDKLKKGSEDPYGYLKRPQIGNFTVNGSALVATKDFSELNRELRFGFAPEVDGVLGLNVLTYCSAIIDYTNMKLYLRNPSKKEPDPKTVPK